MHSTTVGKPNAWSGIVIDGDNGTQLYVLDNPPVSTPNVDFGLSHRKGQTAVMLKGNAYFIGGYPYTNAVTIFNPSTNMSTPGAPLNVARFDQAATVVGDTIIVCGGMNEKYDTLSACEQYDASTQKWNMITSLPTPSSDFVMATLNNRVYTFGGSGVCDEFTPPPVYMLDGQNWVTRSSIAFLPLLGHSSVALDTDRALICGGVAYKGSSCQGVSDCFIYSASNDSWTQVEPMNQTRCGHSMMMFEGERFKNELKNVTTKLQIRYTYSEAIVMTIQQ